MKLDFFSKRIIAKMEALYRNNFKPAFDLYTKYPLPPDSGIAQLMPNELNNDFKVWLLWWWKMPECEFLDDYEKKNSRRKMGSIKEKIIESFNEPQTTQLLEKSYAEYIEFKKEDK